MPRFSRDPGAVYAQLVYATKATDVRDVIVNGQILMRDRRLLTLDEPAIFDRAAGIARQIDAFLTAREGSILSKLLAISADFMPQETYEIQVKIQLPGPLNLNEMLAEAGLQPFRPSRRRQFDTYFFFEGDDTDRLRFREDIVQRPEKDQPPVETFYRMTLMGPTKEREFENSVLLSRARFTTTANQSLRFYREYFRPVGEREVVKERQRCHIVFKDKDFAINLDQINIDGAEPVFLEIKSRTWSAKDALDKAEHITELLVLFGFNADHQFKAEYVDMAERI